MAFFASAEFQISLTLMLGLCFGSFVTMASYRLPREEGMARARSKCPKCDTPLGVADLIPLFSWAVQRGKCRYCGAAIGLRYPVIETVTALVFLLIYSLYGWSGEALILAMTAVALLIMIVVDLETGLLPDTMQLALALLAILYHTIVPTEWSSVLLGALAGLGLGLLLHYGYYALRGRHGLGFGDVKFFAVAGLWLGVENFIGPFIFYAGCIGVAFGALWNLLRRGRAFPFGPALAAALFLLLISRQAGDWFWQLGGQLRSALL